ncbi:MAG: hypothetical protein QXX94_06770 [Candidatus Bathyarchaeia archaeon]
MAKPELSKNISFITAHRCYAEKDLDEEKRTKEHFISEITAVSIKFGAVTCNLGLLKIA